MSWEPTNANDVSLIVSRVERADDGTRTGTTRIVETARVAVDEFSIESEEDMEGLSGVGNVEPLDISRGDVEHSFSFMVQGEDGELLERIATEEGAGSGDDVRSVELEIEAQLEDVVIKLEGAYAGTRNVSGSSGDAIEMEFEGLATSRSTRVV